MAAVLLSLGAAAIVPPRTCDPVGGGGGPATKTLHHYLCEPSWHIGARLSIVGIGIGLALALSFVGARLDGSASRRRRARGRVLPGTYST